MIIENGELYKINSLPEDVIKNIGRELFISKYIRKHQDLSGEDWEIIFAKSIGAPWSSSRNGLGDIKYKNYCWSAKTVHHDSPSMAKKIRIISGRNSPFYSFKQENIGNIDTQLLGDMILDIWNMRVDDALRDYIDPRMIVLIRNFSTPSATVFELPLEKYNKEDFTWRWNKRKNLEGYCLNQKHKFTWQPSGSQFTVIHNVPDKKYNITINTPNTMKEIKEETIMQLMGYQEDWITYF